MKRITKIVTFYDDGTFTEATPSPGYMPTPYVPPAPYTPTPNPYYPPTNPWVQPAWPNPNNITCKVSGVALNSTPTGNITTSV